MESFQSDISKEKLSNFIHITDSDFEGLILKVSAHLKEKDEKSILALRQGLADCLKNPLIHLFRKGQIIKSVPSSFQTLLKKIERMDLMPIVDDFYKNFTKPNVVTKISIQNELKSLHQIMSSITSSLYDLMTFKIGSLIRFSSVLENIFYQGHNIYQSIQDAIMEFSATQSRGMMSTIANGYK